MYYNLTWFISSIFLLSTLETIGLKTQYSFLYRKYINAWKQHKEVSLCSYLYLKLAKIPFFTYYHLCFFFYKIGEQEGGTGSAHG
jgi:hypothetical protein